MKQIGNEDQTDLLESGANVKDYSRIHKLYVRKKYKKYLFNRFVIKKLTFCQIIFF